MEKQAPTTNKPNVSSPIKTDKEGSMNQNFDVRKDQPPKNEVSEKNDQKDKTKLDDKNSVSDVADKGSDSEMAEMPSAEQWKVKINSAKHQWNKLLQDELVTTEGRADRISELVQKRYSVNKAEADKQVAEFFSKH